LGSGYCNVPVSVHFVTCIATGSEACDADVSWANNSYFYQTAGTLQQVGFTVTRFLPVTAGANTVRLNFENFGTTGDTCSGNLSVLFTATELP